MTDERSITKIPAWCATCPWSGVTGECDSDDEGALCCPECGEIASYEEYEDGT